MAEQFRLRNRSPVGLQQLLASGASWKQCQSCSIPIDSLRYLYTRRRRGDDTGSNPVRDANQFQQPTLLKDFLVRPFGSNSSRALFFCIVIVKQHICDPAFCLPFPVRDGLSLLQRLSILAQMGMTGIQNWRVNSGRNRNSRSNPSPHCSPRPSGNTGKTSSKLSSNCAPQRLQK